MWIFQNSRVGRDCFFGKYPYRENNFPVCGPCAVVFEYFEFFKVLLCVGSVLWCVGTLSFFEVPAVCGSPVLWCVGTLKFFKVPCVCGPCVVVCGDFEFFQSSPVCGLCVVVSGDFETFQSSLCVGALCCGV